MCVGRCVEGAGARRWVPRLGIGSKGDASTKRSLAYTTTALCPARSSIGVPFLRNGLQQRIERSFIGLGVLPRILRQREIHMC